MSFNLDRLTAEAEEIWPTKDAPTSDVEDYNTFAHGAFVLGAHSVLDISDTRWKQEREWIARKTDPESWHIYQKLSGYDIDGEPVHPHEIWHWIAPSLRRADDVLRHLGYTREGGQ